MATPMIAYKVLDNGELRSAGAFPAALARHGAAAEASALPCRVELVPSVRAQAHALLQSKLLSSSAPPSVEFPIDRDALALVHASSVMRPSASRAANASAEQHTPAPPLLCRLTVIETPTATPDLSATGASWFDVKLHHAGVYRARGNDAFKREKLKAAVRAYKKALRWLACPAECAFDASEAAAVDPVALACHTNLATTYAKLQAHDKCIAHATRALEIAPASVKALFRRSQALVATRAFEDAVRDLERARELEPANKLVRSALERARAAQTQFVAKQKQAFAQGF